MSNALLIYMPTEFFFVLDGFMKATYMCQQDHCMYNVLCTFYFRSHDKEEQFLFSRAFRD
jgi:hypothetical protein